MSASYTLNWKERERQRERQRERDREREIGEKSSWKKQKSNLNISTSINHFFTLQDLRSLMKTPYCFKIYQSIISHTKIILIKHFCIQKKIEVETHWQINQPANIFFFRSTFSTYIYIYIYACMWVCYIFYVCACISIRYDRYVWVDKWTPK